MACVVRSPVPSYISNTHLYANMTLVDGQLVPLMGRPAPPIPGQAFTQPPPPPPTSAPFSPRPPSLIPRAAVGISRRSRPLTKYHSSQTVWLTTTGGICDQPSVVEQQQQLHPQAPPQQQSRTKTSEVRLFPPQTASKCVVFQDPRSQSND